MQEAGIYNTFSLKKVAQVVNGTPHPVVTLAVAVLVGSAALSPDLYQKHSPTMRWVMIFHIEFGHIVSLSNTSAASSQRSGGDMSVLVAPLLVPNRLELCHSYVGLPRVPKYLHTSPT